MFEVQAVNSTAIQLIGYNHSESVLRIIFNNDTGYDYPNIDPEVFYLMAESTSVGTFFNGMCDLPFQRLSDREVTAFLLGCIRHSNRILVQA